jgi:predicted nucleic acid-binding protein
VKFWDTSALIPLMIGETRSRDVRRVMFSDGSVMVSFLTPIEIASVIARRLRLEAETRRHADEFARTLERTWTEVEIDSRTLSLARRLAQIHSLRTGDAIQLACAVACRTNGTVEFVTLDTELAAAARAEGFAVLPA